MKGMRRSIIRALLLILIMTALTAISTRLRADTTGTCGGQMITIPFDDVSPASIFFCAIAEAFFSGLTNGTTATTYSPGDPVPREQMAAFITRTMDQSLKRGSQRAALGQWWTHANGGGISASATALNPQYLACDGQSIWVSETQSNSVGRFDIRAGELICRRTGSPSPEKIVIVSGRAFVASFQAPGKVYYANFEDTTSGPMLQLTANVGNNPIGITYDGQYLWTANYGTSPGDGCVSRILLLVSTVTTFTQGFNRPVGILFDGTNLWVTDQGDASLKRVDTSNGTVLDTIPLSGTVGHPVFDGANLWIPCAGPDSVYVVRATGGFRGTVLAQLTGNGLIAPTQAAFDGERICVSNSGGNSVSFWKASDLSPITSVFFNIDYQPRGICSDGVTFFVGLRITQTAEGFLARF